MAGSPESFRGAAVVGHHGRDAEPEDRAESGGGRRRDLPRAADSAAHRGPDRDVAPRRGASGGRGGWQRRGGDVVGGGGGGGGDAPILYGQRWVQLAYLSTLALLSDWVCFSVAATPGTWDAIFHHKAETLIDVFLFTNVIFCFLEPAIVARLGLRNVVVGAGFLMTAGCALRSGLEFENFWPYSAMPTYTQEVLGTVLVGAAQPFFQCTPTLLSATWFGKDERAVATSIAINANQIGIATSFIVGGVMAQTETGMNGYFSLITFLSFAVSIGAVVQFQEAPPTPPSSSAANKVEVAAADRKPFPVIAWKLLQTKGFLQPLIAFVVSIGISNAVSAFIGETLMRSGVESVETIDLTGAGFQLAIMFGSIFLGGYVDKSKKYKGVTIALIAITAGLLLPIGAGASLDNSIVLASIIALGLVVGPIQPINCELAVEVAYPEDENAIVALQQVCGNLFSALLVPVLATAGTMTLGPMQGDYALLEVMAVAGLVYFATFDAPLKRLEMDSAAEKSADEKTA
mmetsp:Transcript_35846/g.88267  ORF Transcript_35846/g.88267 Transcript_35846/m.88267 type:complete len:517 (+) Transcript_35846:949-2499(+)